MQIELNYGGTAEYGVVTRVRLLRNNVEIENSGPISQADWQRSETYGVGAGTRHIFQVQVESGSTRSNSPRTIVV